MCSRKKQLLVCAALLYAMVVNTGLSCKKNSVAMVEPTQLAAVEAWITKADETQLLKKSETALRFGREAPLGTNVTLDTTLSYQTIEGFGYTLTGGSAHLIYNLPAQLRNSLLQELFGNGGIGVSYLRISIGASDLDSAVFSYSDLPSGTTDTALNSFSLAPDKEALIPLLKEILAINPTIKIMGSPWSAPVWMKDNKNSKGGSLLPQYYSTYARYFVKYIQGMAAEGIMIDAITPQNEPLHPGNNPSMYMTAAQQADFIKTALGPAFSTAGIRAKIIVYDHNADRPDYPLAILNDSDARKFIHGTAFHLYGGDVSALSQVQAAYPDKGIYFTEQWTGANAAFKGDFLWHTKNIIIGTMLNWSRTALEWNLASNPQWQPHTPGGCTECKGALTIGADVKRNVSYYIIAQIARFVPPGSVRIGSRTSNELAAVAFKTPAQKKVLLVLNENNSEATFSIVTGNNTATVSLPAQAAGTFVW